MTFVPFVLAIIWKLSQATVSPDNETQIMIHLLPSDLITSLNEEDDSVGDQLSAILPSQFWVWTRSLYNIQRVPSDLIDQRLDFVSLLRMVLEVQNKENIPWFRTAMQCLSDSSANQCQTASQLGRGLHCDDTGNIVGIDLSHLHLAGTIQLGALPQSVRSLDLSFNDLETLNLDGLRGKSLERLNIENNHQCHFDVAFFGSESSDNLALKILELSSNQIYQKVSDNISKQHLIREWLNRQRWLKVIVVDGEIIPRESKHYLFHLRMLRVIAGVTNKESIPWYQAFVYGDRIREEQWAMYRIEVLRGCPCWFGFDLSGLGLKGHIDLGSLPRTVWKVDISNNNLSSISFRGQSTLNCMQSLSIHKNDNLRTNFAGIDLSQRAYRLRHLKYLRVSSNQLVTPKGVSQETAKQSFVRQWVQQTKLKEMVIDGKQVSLRV